MVHQILIFDDENVDVVDVEYFCSDYCARQSEYYAGWSGCHELHDQEKCQSCGVHLGYWNEDTNSYVDPKTLLILEQCRKLDNPYHLAPPITNK